ncbi:hypothetical protein VPH35_086201 [Triticum aestivum]|uniref:putative UDP-rhamnose:rhamnosyltransferase 1 n=1 Tax=Triticum aestivum TaxID=4565 RepID=UPI001949F07F|nr:putative UDP-rhamnose:rhamnosyltransferase 1 [Triticum aestivum]
MEEAGGQLEVVMFPWLAFGHMLPFLDLSRRLAARGHAVAFVSTPRNLARLPPVPPHLSGRLRFVPLPLPRVDGLPEGAESTADVPPGEDGLLKMAMDGLAAPLAAFLADAVAAGRRPDWIVHDFCHHWVPPIADEHKVPCAVFEIVLAGLAAFMGSRGANTAHPRTALEDFTVAPAWYPFPSTVAYRRHEAGWLAGTFRPNASGVPDIHRMWQINERCRLAIYRSCDEVEPGMLALLTDLFQKPSIPAGVLLPSPDLGGDDGGVRPDVLRWLDDQPPKSVIYVALGSEAPVTLKNLHELALGLELAGVRFLWALRSPGGTSDSRTGADDRGVLPDGFEERTRGRGMVETGWVPQVKALAHGAVAAFLTHCGWGSTVESFAFGHPLVMLPFVVDQPLVARTMAEKGVGVEVARDETDGSFDRDGVAAAVRRVMVDDEGKVLASNAKKLQEVLADQERQERYIDDVVEHLIRYKDE